MTAAISAKSINYLTVSYPQESFCTKVWRVVREIFETIWYIFDKIQLWRSPSLYQSNLLPATIPNQGNTCFAAAWMQTVATNRLLSGAYRTTLKSHWLVARIFGEHYVIKVLDQYRNRQEDPSSPVDISSLRQAFGFSDDFRQEDATELSQKIQSQMIMPPKGEVTLEDGSTCAFGCRIQTWMPFSKQWRPLDPSRSGEQTYSMPVFSLNFSQNQNAHTFLGMLRNNYLSELTRIQLLDIPNTLVFNITRNGYDQNEGSIADNRAVHAPLFLELPTELLAGQKSPKYVLQGFVSHDLGSSSNGHYVAYVQAAGNFYKMNDGLRTKVGIHEFLQAAKTAYSLNYSKT